LDKQKDLGCIYNKTCHNQPIQQ